MALAICLSPCEPENTVGPWGHVTMRRESPASEQMPWARLPPYFKTLFFFSTTGVRCNMIAIEQVRMEEASFKSFLLQFSLQVPSETIRQGWLLAGQVFLNTSTPSVHFQYTITSFPLSHGAPLVSWHGRPWAQQLEVRYLLQDWWRRISHLPFAEVFGCILCSVSY